jgi:protein TonB
MHEQRNPKAPAWQRALPAGAATLALVFSAGAGLLSHGQNGGARAQTIAAQKSGRVVTSGGGGRARVRTQSQVGPAPEEIINAPEAVVRFEHAAGAPLIFNDARLKLITREQLRRADGEDADALDDGEKSESFLTLPTVTLTNVSGKSVKEVGIGFFHGETADSLKGSVVMGYAASIKPGEAQTFRSEWQRRNMIMPGTFADVSVRLAWVTFADGSTWGSRLNALSPPPPPPMPGGAAAHGMPPPPPPPNRAYVGSGGGAATGTGSVFVGEGVVVEGSGGGSGGVVVAGGGGMGRGRGVGAGEARGGTTIIGGDLRGKLISGRPPAYPAVARSARAQGIVTVKITVDEDGFVAAAEAVSGHPLLRSAAERAARAACFSPTLLSGKPAKVSGSISYNFVLSGEEDEDDR